MSDTAVGTQTTTVGAQPDPFVVQVNWLLGATGGNEQLARRSGNRVSVRTLDNWTAGHYPRDKVTGDVPGQQTVTNTDMAVPVCR
ncbi:hypothetical protein [Modestobacter roseus]|uniref:Uncharacterized protein n=1 Tax=Modestobacter roseus TaxID=1181884 RepID=A0A562IXP3_9ACTN|nr:hypothetical protein [Modestobacter roseus]MQA35970.1 hypothetical protein [Modestobacter roseus]TWH75344.1 hypothetical protein JD78_03900 [Modestobacter roseus]